MSVLPNPINANRTDAKSPIDQDLFDDLRLNQVWLCDQIGASGGGIVYEFKVNGILLRTGVNSTPKLGRRWDSAFVPGVFTPARARLFLEVGGTNGRMIVDCHRNSVLNHPIVKIDHQFSEATQSVGRAGGGFATQSVARATPQISTQAINEAFASENIESIAVLDSGDVLVTLSGTVLLNEDDYEIGDLFRIASATAPANNGTFTIKSVNYDGLPSLLYENGSAVDQNSAAGDITLHAFEYVFLATVDDDFATGETALFAGHTDGNNNGQIEVWRINQGGNNILVKPTNANATTQGAPSGTCDSNRWEYNFIVPVDTDFIVGEIVEFVGHSSGGNNGDFELKKINDGGNNAIVHNESGVVQAGVSGTMDSNHWIYAQPQDPSTDFTVGEDAFFTGHSSSVNDGTFTVIEVNKGGTDNIVVYNPSGTAQGGIAGETRHARKIVTFTDDKAASYSVDESYAALEGLSDSSDEDEYLVKEINRGTVLDFNIVIYAPEMEAQLHSAGRVAFEKRSLFDVLPVIEFKPEQLRNLEIDVTGSLKAANVIPTDSRLTMDLIEVPSEGVAQNLTLSIE